MIEAKYTELFKNWLNTIIVPPLTTNKSTLIGFFTTTDFTNDMATDLVNMLEHVFNYYEIGDSDDIMQYLLDVFNEYSKYYAEVITNYRKEYDYALNNKRVMYKTDELNMVGNTKIDTESNGSTTDYQLPNKVVDEERYRSTPSSITDNDNKGSSDKKYDNNTTRVSEHITEFNNEFIDLKNKYMAQIRNVYREFAMKFKDCFYQIY